MIRRIKVAGRFIRQLAGLPAQLERIQAAIGRIEWRQTRDACSLRESEFQVTSQWGEDGIIQHLLRRVPIDSPKFVEFGVERFAEANTRFLLQHSNWHGLVIDSSVSNVRSIQADPIYWRHDLTAICAFIDASNINGLLRENGMVGDIGLLSIDVDGNDYWIWKAIDVVSPRIVICEYNGLFGARATVSVPYEPGFVRTRFHYSHLVAGASLAALAHLGQSKGYRLVGTNSAGNNAFFVREDVSGDVPAIAPEIAYSTPRFREARNADGSLSFAGLDAARALVADVEVEDVLTGRKVRLQDIDY